MCVCYGFGAKTKIKPSNGSCYTKLIEQIRGGGGGCRWHDDKQCCISRLSFHPLKAFSVLDL